MSRGRGERMQIEAAAAVVQGRAAFHTAASEVDVNNGNNDRFP